MNLNKQFKSKRINFIAPFISTKTASFKSKHVLITWHKSRSLIGRNLVVSRSTRVLGESDWSLIFLAISSSYSSKPRRTFALSSLKSEFESKRRFTRLFSVEQFDNPIVETKCIVLCYISLPISEQRGKNFKLLTPIFNGRHDDSCKRSDPFFETRIFSLFGIRMDLCKFKIISGN